MKAAAALLLVLTLLVAGVPYLNNCQHEGKMLTLANGTQAPMKCYWTAQAELALALPLLGLSFAFAFSRRKETRRLLGALGVLLGLGVIALPTSLIGTCSMDQASCNLVMKPALILLGTLVAGASALGALVSEARPEAVAQPQAAPQPQAGAPTRPAEL